MKRFKYLNYKRLHINRAEYWIEYEGPREITVHGRVTDWCMRVAHMSCGCNILNFNYNRVLSKPSESTDKVANPLSWTDPEVFHPTDHVQWLTKRVGRILRIKKKIDPRVFDVMSASG